MEDIKKIIGERIRSERLRRNISADELAAILNVSPSFIGLIERGQRGTNIKLLSDISNIFQLSIDEIISDKKLSMCESKNNERSEKIASVNSLLHTLDVHELDFVILTIKNLYAMKNKESGKKNSDETTECFY